MLVYGDPQFELPLGDALGRLDRLRVLCSESLHGAREFLIVAGQVEQGVADEGGCVRPFEELTDTAAETFLAWMRGRRPAAIRNLSLSADDLQNIRIKIPEGFAFYVLYPDQYVRAAEEWVRLNREAKRVLVAGIRSIGTSLSAVVGTILRERNYQVQRLTTRPEGHPFRREAKLSGVEGSFDEAIIVDEGPGLSGSSMASVCREIEAAGIRSISFFPGHAGGPGEAADESIRKIWKRTPSYVFPFNHEWGHGAEIFGELRIRSEKLLGTPDLEFLNLSGGAWKGLLGVGREVNPSPRFERVKWLFRAGGAGVIWKFAGMGAGRGLASLTARAFQRQAQLAAAGFAAKPLDSAHGFIASKWVEGRPLIPGDAEEGVLQKIALYIAAAANPQPLGRENFQRLREMASSNLQEALGSEIAAHCKMLAEDIEDQEAPCLYGDGRMSPHEWIRTPGEICKMDVWGHDWDHTCVGEQSVLWDIASTIVEWRLNHDLETIFLRMLPWAFPANQLAFYKLAWIGFRLGMLKIDGIVEGREVEWLRRKGVQLCGRVQS